MFATANASAKSTTHEIQDDRSIYTLDPIDLNEAKFEKILIANRGIHFSNSIE